MENTVAQIQKTNDYSKFKIMSSNRSVDKNHVSRIAESMKENPHLFETRPILVNENMFVVDGQHRLEAAKKNGMPIYYVVSSGITVEDTRTLNTTQINWSLLDFARSYASTGNQHYKAYLQAISKYPNLTPTVVRMMLGSNPDQSGTNDFKRGLFTVDRPNLSDVYLERLSEIRHLIPDINITRSYAHAFYALFEKPSEFDYDYFVSHLKIDSAAMLMRNASTIKDAMRCIEDVYNYNRNQKNRVRFY